MKNRGAHIRLALLIILLASVRWPAATQTVATQEELSEELATIVRVKWEAIKLESQASSDEWTGSYRSFDGPTITTYLAWSPTSGFMVWWENCSRPWLARVNYGRAELVNGSLKLSAQLSESSPGSFQIASEYIPAKWGGQHFLIPSDKMINFSYAANSGSVPEIESFLMKIEDYEKERKGLPNVPSLYAQYLRRKPIIAAASGFGPKVKKWYPYVILSAGRSEGVVPEMKFYLSRPGNIFMLLEVTSVQEHISEASVVMATFKDNREADVKPKVGWKFTSRAPKDNWQFMP